jgi:hypothetical protein
MASFGGSTMDREFAVVVRLWYLGPVVQRTSILIAPAWTVNLDTGSLPGSAAYLTATGTTSTGANALTIIANQLPQDSFGMLIVSQTQGFVVNAGGSQGTLCLAGGIGRFRGPGQIQSSGTSGLISVPVSLARLPFASGGFASAHAGQVWNFQMWYRDTIGGVATSNFTQPLEIYL